MIFPAIDVIRIELTNSGIGAELGNIGEILADNTHSADTNIIISLINIEENRVSRDPQNYVRNGIELILKNPAINLYLTVLFTSVRDNGGYGLALQTLQKQERVNPIIIYLTMLISIQLHRRVLF